MNKNTLVWCKTKAQVREVLAKAEKMGYRMTDLDDYTERFWGTHERETVINLNGDGRCLTYCYKEWYEEHPNYGKIITADKFLGFNPIVIKRNGKLTIAEDKNTGEKGIASCSPDDTYDFHTGALIAVARLVAKDSGISGDAETVLRKMLVDDTNSDAPTEKEPTTKFKVGDLVTLKNGIEPGKTYGDMTLYHGDMFDSINGKPERVIEVWKRSKNSPSYKTESEWYYSEEMLEAWDENKIREGDRVHVKDGCTKDRYDTYYEWLKDNIYDVDLLLGFERRDSVSAADVYTVVKIGHHKFFTDCQLAFIKRTDGLGNTYSYLFDINALEKVTK